MHRYATAPRSTFDELFEEAREATVVLAEAEHPPVCETRRGDVTLALGPSGAMIVHVAPGPCPTPDFRLRMLFETGTCIFSDARDLHAFWTGPLAVAFGIEPSPPVEEPAPDPADAPDVPEGQQTLLGDLAPRATADPATAAPRENAGAPVRPRRVTAAGLAEELARVVHGQDAALERVAATVVAQLAKSNPARPGSVLLLGPTGVGKTSTVEALPRALAALGGPAASVYRLDCGELTGGIQTTRLLGAPPGYVGYAESTPLLDALGRRGCILLVDEVEKAHDEVLDLLLGLLDAGRLTGSAGKRVDARHAVVVMTTSVGADELERRLGRTPLDNRWAVQRAAAEHLRAFGLSPDLVGRIGAFALYGELDVEQAGHGLAEAAVTSLADEYGLAVADVDPIVLDVVADIAAAGNDTAGARALHHAAQELLGEHFAALVADGPRRRVVIEAGPPLTVTVATAAKAAGAA
jgi:hypothetical protein